MNFSDFFRKPQGLPKGRFKDFWRFFDILELQGPSLNDPGSIWETSFFHKNSQKNEPEKFQEWKNENSQYPTKLRFEQAIRCSFSWETRWWSQISNWFPKFHKCYIKMCSNPWPRLNDHPILSENSACAVITLSSICSKSHVHIVYSMKKKTLESPRRDNTCASMGKFEKIGPKSRSERCFLMTWNAQSTVNLVTAREDS